MILPILATCLNLQTVTLNGVAMPCNPGLVQYYPREREVRIVGREVAIFWSGME